jgi:LytTr DNA-binding domain
MITERAGSSTMQPTRKAAGDGTRSASDARRGAGIGGEDSGTDGTLRRTFVYSYGFAAAVVGLICYLNVISFSRGGHDLMDPVVGEATSWVSFTCFFWIIWLGWRWAPPSIRPHWMLGLHLPVALGFSLAHVGGFAVLRHFVFGVLGARHEFGNFTSEFLYEFSKDAVGYVFLIAAITAIDRLLRHSAPAEIPANAATFDIRDGASVARIRVDEILAVTSAGNYVEFVLRDGRRLLMRSPLSALERELAPRGFLRTHRSWLVNAGQVTALKPEGSGDYAVELQSLTVPLSRRFPESLAKLKHPRAVPVKC